MILSGFNTIQVIHTASGRCCCNQAGDRIARIEDYRFNTASGRHCYFITFVFPSLQSGTRDVRSSSSLHSSAASHPSSHTASGRYCCNLLRRGRIRRPLRRVSIPKAVSTVTSSPLFSLPFDQGLEMCGPHRRFTPLLPRTLRRIPQAVGTVATLLIRIRTKRSACSCFNTASGKYCYFITFVFPSFQSGTRDVRPSSSLCSSAVSHPSSHTASGKHCCNKRYN